MDYERKPVPTPGYEDRYYLDPEIMSVVNAKTNRPLKPWFDKNGYPEVQLWKGNKGKHASLHRLFAEAYIPNPDDLPCINHKDENRANYDINNLEWCTQTYNQNYGTANEKRGPKISAALKGKSRPWIAEQKGRPVIGINDEGDVIEFSSGREAARQLGLSLSSVNEVCRGRQKTAGGYRFKRKDDL